MNTTEPQVRVYIVELHMLFASALAHLLLSDGRLSVVGLAPSPLDIPIQDGEADVIVLDIDDHVGAIETAVNSLREACPSAALCALSMHLDSAIMHQCIRAGMAGYVVKDTSETALLSVLECTGQGGSYVDPRLAGDLLRRRHFSTVRGTTELSPRENEIVRLIAQGLTNRDIGARLLLSEKTVKNHVSRIFSKLHLSKRSQAAIHATRNGLA